MGKNLCKNCKFHVMPTTEQSFCKHKEARIGNRSLVTGEWQLRTGQVMRSTVDLCGIEGSNFIKRDGAGEDNEEDQ